MFPPRAILVPVDFSPGSKAALRLALELARHFDASLTLLHVYSMPPIVYGEGMTLPAELLLGLAEDSRKALERLKGELAEERLTILTESIEGPPANVIAERGRRADLIVMGTHGRTGLKHVFLGSVAERVLRLAQCPVMTVREPHEATAG